MLQLLLNFKFTVTGFFVCESEKKRDPSSDCWVLHHHRNRLPENMFTPFEFRHKFVALKIMEQAMMFCQHTM